MAFLIETLMPAALFASVLFFIYFTCAEMHSHA